MYNPEIFASGVYGVLKAHWKLRCETPLAIRNGKSIFYQTGDEKSKKTRGMQVRFAWKQPPPGSGTEHTVAALHYGYQVRDGKLEQMHFVPPSSVRGSLRAWTINHLVRPDYRSKMSPPRKEKEAETEAYLNNLRQALADDDSGYHWIASLFGLALETRLEEENLSNAGRLRIETTPFTNAKAQPISVNGVLEDGLAGPGNARRQMTVRNPLDRITHASKEGGLHHFLEFSRGETFNVCFTVLNPQGSDLGLFSLWRREIDDGMLRLGALSSIGRGRVSITEQSYQLWMNPNIQKLDWLESFETAENLVPGDALADLWTAYQLAPDVLDSFVSYLQEKA
ncbi:MAG: RAMP superfamily CRISPR-associated protein [Chloroflexota bacterium]